MLCFITRFVEHTGNNRIKHVIAVKEIYESTVIEIFKWYLLNSLNLKQINVFEVISPTTQQMEYNKTVVG